MTQAVVDQANFTVRYDGEALREHRMDVRDLAPALLGLAEVFQSAHTTLSPGEPPVTLEIRATPDGSFMVDLSVICDHAEDLLNSPGSTAAGVLISFIMGGAGLFSFVSKRRRATSEGHAPDGSVTLIMPDGTVLVYPPQVETLVRQPGVRQGVRSAVRPLAQPGIDTMDLRETREADPWVTITDEDLGGIGDALADTDNERPLLVDTQYDQLLTVVAPNFQRGAKWKVRDSPRLPWFWISMDDPGFWAKVDAREVAFAQGDRLHARVWLRQWEGDAGEIHTERSVLRVIQHIPASRPIQEAMFGPAADQWDQL